MRERLTYANVTATIALFLALGLGGAYAADKITSKDLAKSAVTSKVIKDKAVKGKDVRDKTLIGADYKDGSVASADLADGGVAPADLAPSSLVAPALGNGAEGDCNWTDATVDFSGAVPVSYRRNALGEIDFSGAAAPVDGPGGDAVCGGAADESPEDNLVLTIPEADRPALSLVLPNVSGGGIIVVAGVNGILSGSSTLSPGGVYSATSSPAFLNEIEFLAANASGPAPASSRPDRISPRTLRKLTG